MFRGGPADHCQQLSSHVNFNKLAQRCRNRKVQLAHHICRSGSYVSTNQYENIWGWGGGTCICAQHGQTFFCHHCIHNTVCNDYLPSIHIMWCISSSLELPKVFRRLCVSHMSTAEERFEHLRVWVSKMDLRTNPPLQHGETTTSVLQNGSRTVLAWHNMGVLCIGAGTY